MPDIAELLDHLAAESAEVDAMVAVLDPAGWTWPTPAAGWTIAHQIAHLSWTDSTALKSVTDVSAFHRDLAVAAEDPAGFVDHFTNASLAPPDELLRSWREHRSALAKALAAAPHDQRLPWYGVSMSPVSMATGRLMETWAHGLDIADTLGRPIRPTARLRHVALLATRTFEFSFAAHDRPVPADRVRVELTAPDGALWTFGAPGDANVITGPALDFCLIATRRRHLDDLDLKAIGPVAAEWLEVIQAFAGPPGARRDPLGKGAGGHVAPQ
jgi:uncharacterized protein (TIGR03084 family)